MRLEAELPVNLRERFIQSLAGQRRCPFPRKQEKLWNAIQSERFQKVALHVFKLDYSQKVENPVSIATVTSFSDQFSVVVQTDLKHDSHQTLWSGGSRAARRF